MTLGIRKSVYSSNLYEVMDRILDKGIVIDIYSYVSIVGLKLISIDARIVISSVETWIKYAKSIGLADDRIPPTCPLKKQGCHGDELLCITIPCPIRIVVNGKTSLIRIPPIRIY